MGVLISSSTLGTNGIKSRLFSEFDPYLHPLGYTLAIELLGTSNAVQSTDQATITNGDPVDKFGWSSRPQRHSMVHYSRWSRTNNTLAPGQPLNDREAGMLHANIVENVLVLDLTGATAFFALSTAPYPA